MSGSQLPLGLLDLVLARTFSATRQPTRHGSLLLASGGVAFKRYAQSAAALKPRMEPQFEHSLVVCVIYSFARTFLTHHTYSPAHGKMRDYPCITIQLLGRLQH